MRLPRRGRRLPLQAALRIMAARTCPRRHREAVRRHGLERGQNPQQRADSGGQMWHALLHAASTPLVIAFDAAGSRRARPDRSAGSSPADSRRSPCRRCAARSFTVCGASDGSRAIAAPENGMTYGIHADLAAAPQPALGARAASPRRPRGVARGELRIRSRNGVMPSSSAAVSIGSMCGMICALLNSASTCGEKLSMPKPSTRKPALRMAASRSPSSRRCGWC